MEIIYQRNIDHSFMILQGLEDGGIEEYEEEMLTRNRIPSLLRFYKVSHNGEDQYWYDITGMKSLGEYISEEGLSEQSLYQIMVNLSLSMKESNQYLLKQEHLLLTKDTIYIRKGQQFEMLFTYGVKESTDLMGGIQELFEYFLTVVDHTNKGVMEKCYELYRMAKEDNAPLEELVAYVSDVDGMIPQELNPSGIDGFQEEMIFQTDSMTEDLPQEVGEKNGKGKLSSLRQLQPKDLADELKSRVRSTFREVTKKAMDKYRGKVRSDRKAKPENFIYDPGVDFDSDDTIN